ncbi:MAG: carbon-nitrogen hydrolase family protein [Candidatus Hydrogenedentota bacterium]|nr:MAG: carbon-nitrogen hydrolase family protein [Candidatus Hydrogenedentota bacterium]
MSLPYEKFNVAAVQAAPYQMNTPATVDKACKLITDASASDVRLIVFPELFVPGYPNVVPMRSGDEPSIPLTSEGESWLDYWADFTRTAVQVPGPETDLLGEAAAKADAYVVVGVNERDEEFGPGTAVFNTAVLIGPDGGYIGKHRKLVPTFHEQLYHSRGDGSDLKVFDTIVGKLGMTICYEHLQPLMKYSYFAMGEQIHCAVWPGCPDAPLSIRHIVDAASRQYAIEGGVFVVVASQVGPPDPHAADHRYASGWKYFGGSGIINPLGLYLEGPLYDKEGILVAEIDPREIGRAKAIVDITGINSRPDVFSLSVRTDHAPLIRKIGAEAAPPQETSPHTKPSEKEPPRREESSHAE